MASKVFRKSILSVRDQAARMLAFPAFKTQVQGAWLVSQGEVRPSALSAQYRIEIRYAVGKPPEMRVLSPALVCREMETKIPHMYKQERLCLYFPGSGEWSGEMPLGRTLLPWISLWLYYYEMWHATGEWLGGGIEPVTDKETIRNEREQPSYERHPR